MLTDAVNDPHVHDSEIVADIVTERLSDWVSEKNNATPQQIKKAREIAKKAKNVETARKAVEAGGVKSQPGAMWSLDSTGRELSNAQQETKVSYSQNDNEKMNSFGLADYPIEEKKSISRDRKNLFATSEQDIVSFVNENIVNRSKDYIRLFCGKISTALGERIKSDTGYDLTGANLVIDSFFENKHSNEEKERLRGQQAISPEMLAKLPAAIANYDSVKYEEETVDGRKAFVFTVDIDGEKRAVEYYSKSRNILSLKTIYGWKSKKNLSGTSDAKAPDTTSKTTHGFSSYTDSMPDSTQNVKPSFALDSVGRELSEGQREYFKASVVRDEQGRLKLMYHGTSSGGFTIFDTFGGNHGLFGIGSYFTDSKTVAEGYTRKGKGKNQQIYPCYLNITNPIDMDAVGNRAQWQEAFPDASLPETGTNEEFYRAVEDYFADEMYPKWEAADAIRGGLEGMGYDGITHIGGGRTRMDSEQHRVYIAFFEEQIKSVDNLKPTTDADIRYSVDHDLLRETVEAIDK